MLSEYIPKASIVVAERPWPVAPATRLPIVAPLDAPPNIPLNKFTAAFDVK